MYKKKKIHGVLICSTCHFIIIFQKIRKNKIFSLTYLKNIYFCTILKLYVSVLILQWKKIQGQ